MPLISSSFPWPPDLRKPVSRIGWFIIGTLFARKDRRTDLHTGMEQTLERLRQVAERQTTPT